MFVPAALVRAAFAPVLLATSSGITAGSPDARPACVRGTIAMTSDVDSASSRPGDSFGFRMVGAVTAADGTVIPAGAAGFGVVAISTHAARGGRGGYVVIETRFVAPAGGKHVPVTIDWGSAARATATGASRNIPGIVGAVPLVGYVLGPYGFLHHGKDVTIPRDAQIPVFVGDDIAAGTCRVPTPAPNASPAPSATPVPSASPVPAPSPMS